MKKVFFPVTILAMLTACSGDNTEKRKANDTYSKNSKTPVLIALHDGGLNLPTPDPAYQLPDSNANKHSTVDIRPPSAPMAIIGSSVAQFDGERASIVYPSEKRAVYNLQQVQRLLTENGIKYIVEDNVIYTDWTETGRSDDVDHLQIRYQISEIGNKKANALTVSVLQMKRNNIVFTPSVSEKQRYTSDRLNQWIGELNSTYQTQRQQLNLEPTGVAIQSRLTTDSTGRTALGLNAPFTQSWHKLADVLPELGFQTKKENPARGYREMKYKAVDEKQWLRLGVVRPNLENGKYYLQLMADGKRSAVVISDEEQNALNGEQAQTVYQALQALLAQEPAP